MDESKFAADKEILVGFLMLAVPLQILEIKAGRVPLVIPRPDLATILGEHGDVLLFGGKGAGKAATALVEAIATLSFAPGGVTAFGLHFETDGDMICG